nr:unnamed protein product [Digitaria exilis]
MERIDPANLAIGASVHADTAKLGHGGNEGVEEGRLVGREVVDGGPGAAVGEEHLVGGEEALHLL